eukprot:1825669-Heterocapsa_arctica.AAC.1
MCIRDRDIAMHIWRNTYLGRHETTNPSYRFDAGFMPPAYLWFHARFHAPVSYPQHTSGFIP